MKQLLDRLRARAGLLVLSAFAKAVAALGTLALARFLGATGDTDTLLLVQTVWLTVQTLAAAGFVQTLVYEIQGRDLAGRRAALAPHWAMVCLYTALSLVLAGVLEGLSWLGFGRSPMLQMSGLALLFAGPGLLAQLALQRLIGAQRTALVVATPALSGSVMALVLIFAAAPSASQAFLAYCLGVLLECVVLVGVARLWRELSWPDTSALRQGLRANLPFVGAYALFVPVPLIDALFASRLGEGALSVFQFGLRFPVFVSSILVAVLVPLAAHRFAATALEGPNAVSSLVRARLPMLCAGALAAGALAAGIAALVLPWVLRDGAAVVQASAVALLASGTAVGSIAGAVLGRALGSLRTARPVAEVAALALGVRVTLDALLSITLGVSGLALAGSLAACAAVSLQYWALVRFDAPPRRIGP